MVAIVNDSFLYRSTPTSGILIRENRGGVRSHILLSSVISNVVTSVAVTDGFQVSGFLNTLFKISTSNGTGGRPAWSKASRFSATSSNISISGTETILAFPSLFMKMHGSCALCAVVATMSHWCFLHCFSLYSYFCMGSLTCVLRPWPQLSLRLREPVFLTLYQGNQLQTDWWHRQIYLSDICYSSSGI